MTVDLWRWTYEGYDPSTERLREALCTLGNGYLGTRGACSETPAGPGHYPGTYVAGCYDRLTSSVAGRSTDNEEMVNLPNWLPLRFRVAADGGDGTWLSPDSPRLTAHRQTLDLRAGTLRRWSEYAVDTAGGRLAVEQTRLVHMHHPHLAAQRTAFTPVGWSGTIEVESGIDGDVRNAGVARYRDLAGRHLTDVCAGTDGGEVVWLQCRTVDSDVRVAVAARTRAAGAPEAPRTTEVGGSAVAQRLRIPVRDGATAHVDKTAAIHTSRDTAIGSAGHAARAGARDAEEFPRLLASHRRAWDALWQRARVDVPGEAGHILHLHLFHVLQTLSPHTADLDVGVPARGLHGEAYRGHVFWDELFVLPWMNLHFPEVSRSLLAYRHRRLPAARRAARAAGAAGAMYPWQSGSDGREETPRLHLNPRSGRWLADHSRLQHHVGSAVAYNVWQYASSTADTDFLLGDGAEMLLEVARFWADRAEWDGSLERYRIHGVVGPDEYHDSYPGASTPGLSDNAYTNVTAAWVLSRALDVHRALPPGRRDELSGRLGLRPDEPERWEHVAHTLHVPFHDGVISQFAGYEALAELDWAAYRRRYPDIRRLDRLLEAEGDSVNRYRASKQADVLMLGYLFSPRELHGLMAQLGVVLDDAVWRSTVDYYLRRTSHGSTLSSVVHAWVLARSRPEQAWHHAWEALTGDVADLQGGTTPEGVHLGAMAGTLDFVQRGLTGLEQHDGALWLDPAPLPELARFRLGVRVLGHRDVELRFRRGAVLVEVPRASRGALRVRLAGREVLVQPGQVARLRLPPPAVGARRAG
ncbi:glycoside hydrolase family 65 protein [Streptomyces bohaiensis]|uniref:Glycoside hydrolase family 65 protein n=1 Tax=Streptomyces bohaiensis TaxID=1431344 RepID=A0ABX1CB55_9ACTN|nr:glycoside hydrolase family 65 protein [Streptomyces bohaiensis]NJQ15506.1 glycoside hydrolase family 65 protein [Streptomyces bohaiensis]